MKTSISCTAIIEHGCYVKALFKKWEDKEIIFEGNVNRDTVCRVMNEFQSKYPGSFKDGIICGIREDSQGTAEFWVAFPSEVKGVFYASWVPGRHIDWEEYFRYSRKN